MRLGQIGPWKLKSYRTQGGRLHGSLARTVQGVQCRIEWDVEFGLESEAREKIEEYEFGGRSPLIRPVFTNE